MFVDEKRIFCQTNIIQNQELEASDRNFYRDEIIRYMKRAVSVAGWYSFKSYDKS